VKGRVPHFEGGIESQLGAFFTMWQVLPCLAVSVSLGGDFDGGEEQGEVP